MAIHWVTPKQRRRLDGIVAGAAEVGTPDALV